MQGDIYENEQGTFRFRVTYDALTRDFVVTVIDESDNYLVIAHAGSYYEGEQIFLKWLRGDDFIIAPPLPHDDGTPINAREMALLLNELLLPTQGMGMQELWGRWVRRALKTTWDEAAANRFTIETHQGDRYTVIVRTEHGDA